MSHTQPQLPIQVDQDTGVWATDGLPMLYMPRHFFANLHFAAEEALGIKTYAEILYKAGHKSAWYWCEQEATTHKLEGVEVFAHYLQRLSQRGWGQFAFDQQNLKLGSATIRVDNSAFVLHSQKFGLAGEHNTCTMFAGWWAGAADWVAHNQHWHIHYKASEHSCAACGASHCSFDITQSR